MKTKHQQHKTIAIIIALTVLLTCNLFARRLSPWQVWNVPIAGFIWNAFNSGLNNLVEWRNDIDDRWFNGAGADKWRVRFGEPVIEEDIELMMGQRTPRVSPVEDTSGVVIYYYENP